jgi:translation initiation factor IF-2
MAETTTLRLMAAAKEFNIGKETLVEFLVAKGFDKDELKPTSKLTEDMYRALQQEFQSDKVAKLKSDAIDLPKGSLEAKKKKEEEALVVFKKETKKAEQPAAVEAKPEEKPVVEKPPVEEPKPEPKPEVVKMETPEIEAPKVLDKIDLDAIDSSTRPKKGVKKKTEEKPEEEEKPVEEVTAKQKKEEPAPKKEEVKEEPVEQVQEEKEEEKPQVVSNIKAEKLTGPTILGKIELPAGQQAQAKANKPLPADERRKRKRIPIEKKGGGQQQQGQGQGQGAAHLFKRRDGGQQQGGQQQGRGGQGGQGQGQGGYRQGGQGQQQGGGQFRRQGGPQRGTGRPIQREAKEIDEKEIQNKIRETQAKLAGGGGGRTKTKAKYRREKREERAEQAGAEEGQDNKLQVTEFISVSELANLMDVNFADVISKCMSLGLMVSINQRLDAEVIELVANEFGFDVEFIDMEKQMEMEEEDNEEDEDGELQSRAPIVTIMGHVDHGKTSLLDYIRNANVVAGEAGGITQHIGAYEVTLPNGKNITFLDTPGHEAFTAMRARGAKVTDIAVIVVAADDAVMPQTKEAISHAQAAGVPMIFAINKIDKDGANPQKIYEQLAGMNLLVEEWGGKFQSQQLSAKKGLNVENLLEKILLEAELLDLKSNPDREASGTIVEATLDKGRGYVATVLVQNGTLKQGDLVVSGQFYGRVKAMFNERNKREETAPPSTPVLILGLNGAPQAGEKFRVYEDEAEAKEVANRRAQILREQGIRTKKHITLDEIGRRLALGNFKQLNLILKGDVDGSVEALSDSLQKLSTEEIVVSVVHKAVGAITESVAGHGIRCHHCRL